MNAPRVDRRPEVGGLSYEAMIATVKMLPDMLSNFQEHVDRRIDRIEKETQDRSARFEAKIDLIHTECARKENITDLRKDLDKGFDKMREMETTLGLVAQRSGIHTDSDKELWNKLDSLDTRLRTIETNDAADRGENKGRFTYLEKIGGIVLGFVLAAAMAYLGLK